MDSNQVSRAAAPLATPKGPRPQKANAFKQALARAMEGAGPDAPAARTAPRLAARSPAAVSHAHGIAASTASAAMAVQTGRGVAPRGVDPFRNQIALAEGSREQYGVRNAASGALGRYQFVPQALQDLGWKDAGGQWTATAARHGVTSDAEFLASPAAQEAAMTTYLARTEQQLSHNGSLAQAGGSVPGLDGQAVPLTEAGLIAAAHRRGAGSVARYLAHRAHTPDASLTQQQRQAFASVERRLRDFADMPYALASRRAGTTPSA